LGEFVSYYIKENNEYSWLNNYFKGRIEFYFENIDNKPKEQFIISSLLPTELRNRPIVSEPVFLKSILPHNFRGFRKGSVPIQFDSKLVIIEGRNSQGKTSLVEALEWLLTGSLSRRDSKDLGDSKELENCISNSFRPHEEDTWVEAVFVKNEEIIKLKRILTKDYGKTRNDACSSVLYKNNIELTIQEESDLKEQLFGLVPPILMQHTLGDFVKNNPSERYKYFDSLLNLDGLTNLIERSSISDEMLNNYKFSNEFSIFEKFKIIVNKRSNYLSRYENVKTAEKEDFLTKLLNDIAHKDFFHSSLTHTVDDSYNLIKNKCKSQKDELFPIYENIRPNQLSQNIILNMIEKYEVSNWIDEARSLFFAMQGMEIEKNLHTKLIVMDTIRKLMNNNLLNTTSNLQTCPLCNHIEEPTLSLERIDELTSDISVTTELIDKNLELENQFEILINDFDTVFNIIKNFLPYFPTRDEILKNLDKSELKIKENIISLSDSYNQIKNILNNIDIFNARLNEISNNLESINFSELDEIILSQCQLYTEFIKEARSYLRLFSHLDQIFSMDLEEDIAYKKMSNWLACFENIGLLKIELDWEISKKYAQHELKSVREKLIEYRHNVLESKRSAFNEEISIIWNALRGDRYSKFQSLYIPKSKGRGFPIEINVMAVLDDGNQVKKVDALRIFSESQINALGISAFITRSKILGHKFIIFDDPVQSMDEEHFKTFTSGILRKLLDDNFQVIIFTHSDQFAREISHNYWNYDQYTTMHVRHLRKQGCQVEEGNRRVSERLRMVIKFSDDGNFSEAWKYIRLAIERMYVIISLKYTPKFNPSQWEGQTADYMWKQGTAQILDKHKPEFKERLKSILTMSASGAHDKSPYGQTDIMNAVKDINSLLSSLQISD
jgi:DNA repair exonuclease SbcCD ATPase subunit